MHFERLVARKQGVLYISVWRVWKRMANKFDKICGKKARCSLHLSHNSEQYEYKREWQIPDSEIWNQQKFYFTYSSD